METAATPGLPHFSAQTRLLVVAPHPDDETIATGILIQQVLAAGGAIRVLLLTAGDNNPWPQRWIERRVRIGPRERERWGRRRRAEILAALDKLGVDNGDLQCLAWPDMGLTDCLMNPAHRAVDTLQQVIEAFAPSLVAMPSLDDRHPDHGATHVMLRLAVAKSTCRPQLLAYLVHGRPGDVRHVSLAGSTAQQTNKHAALRQHQSQMVLSGRRISRWAARPERYVEVPLALTATAKGALPWQPSAWMASRLRLSVVSAAGATSWRWADAPVQRTSDGSFHLEADVVPISPPGFAKLAWDLHSFWIFDHWGWCEL